MPEWFKPVATLPALPTDGTTGAISMLSICDGVADGHHDVDGVFGGSNDGKDDANDDSTDLPNCRLPPHMRSRPSKYFLASL